MPSEKCVIGKSYKTRFGWVKLRERNVNDVELALKDIPENVAVAREGTGAIMRARPELVETLERWRDAALSISQAILDKMALASGGYVARPGLIYVNSCYRALSTTAGSGYYADPCGCIDSTDNYGHWSGFAIDVPTKYFRKSCYPQLSVEQINLAAELAGLTRPFLIGSMGGEWWHYRAKPG